MDEGAADPSGNGSAPRPTELAYFRRYPWDKP